jgi:Zn-dependent M28 family amino/carboxypeptidase
MIRDGYPTKTLAILAVLPLMAVTLACEPRMPPLETAEEPAVELPAGAREAAQAITGELLREHVATLADDEMEGRGPGTAGDEMARQYLIEQLQELGLEPGGPDGSWEQPFTMVGITSQVPQTWAFQRNDQELALQRTEDFVVFAGNQAPSARVEDAEIVFVGYGIQAPEYDWDDVGDADLTGKVLLMMNNDPDWDPELFAGERRLYYGRWTYKYESAARQGAAGAIIIHTTPSAGYGWNVVQTSWSGEQSELPVTDEPRMEVRAWVTEGGASRLAQLAGHDLAALKESARSRDFTPVPLGVTTSIDITNELRGVETANVLGVIPGRDPELSREVVIYSAHHDHLGKGEDLETGEPVIYNGARDNAAGTASLLTIAKAFQQLPEPPRRSILFAFVGAEEQGLLGSLYYAQNPTFHPGRIAAVLNYDGGNIWGTTEDVTFIGKEKSTLGEIVRRHAAEQGRVVNPDQFPDRGYYYRSDQFSFAKIGVPGMYLDTGLDFIGRPESWGREQIDQWTQEHYHQPSDELTDEWTFEGMVQDTRLGFFVGLEVAEGDEMPQWVPGDEFEATRLEMLAGAEEEEEAEPAAAAAY